MLRGSASCCILRTSCAIDVGEATSTNSPARLRASAHDIPLLHGPPITMLSPILTLFNLAAFVEGC